MTTSIVSICNRALARIGGDTITSLDENSKEARTMNLLYDSVRQELLRSHVWNFAIRRSVLASETTTPEFEYVYQFALPADCLRVVKLHEQYAPYKVENRKIFTNDELVYLIYIKDVTDPVEFDASFTTCLTLKLALEAAYAITNKATLVAQLSQEFMMAKREAKQFDAQEGSPEEWSNFDWIDNR